jgi:ABC-type multidrug transport system permease subunit
MDGSYSALFLVALVGAIALLSMGLLVASRVTSEELAGGLLNLFTWPMMLLSGVWFPLEDADAWVRQVANIFPLTHVLNSARSVMLDGATLLDVTPALISLLLLSMLFLGLGAAVFRWRAT